jgi:hypothetical protein
MKELSSDEEYETQRSIINSKITPSPSAEY